MNSHHDAPAEDGWEVPEVVGYRSKLNGLVDEDSHVLHEAEPLMTVAQHSRIVAAKDAEIAKFKEANRELGESNVRRRNKIVELMQKLDAQPARQVGGDELRVVFDGPPGPECGRFVEVENVRGESINAGEWRQREDGLWELVIARAALAPSAVVMPEYCRSEVIGATHWNAALDEVARLNRNPIPVELLDKLAHCTDPDCCIAHARGELRALLGK